MRQLEKVLWTKGLLLTPQHLQAMYDALEQASDQPIAGPPSGESVDIESAESRAARRNARRAARRERAKGEPST